MKITRQRLKEIIKEELAEAEETALNSPREAGRQWAVKNLAVAVDSALGSGLNNTEIRAIVEDNLPEDNWRGNKNPLREDADDVRDAEIEEATRDGKADGVSGSEREGPGGHFQKYYDEAYDRAAKKRTK